MGGGTGDGHWAMSLEQVQEACEGRVFLKVHACFTRYVYLAVCSSTLTTAGQAPQQPGQERPGTGTRRAGTGG